ncbi:MAG: type VI secretion system contractile sheath large subunit, partial [Thermodesulfobacteriota bacterium]|nr:type VI secretion system contractile sheath large subunit [Thermodesulfobacteriota bacterium]
MPKPISFGELDFNLVASMKETHGALEAETPFRILLMGDFSGRANRSREQSGTPLSNLRPILVDRDNFDKELAKLAVKIELSILGENAPPVSIHFSELDDFHPDALYRRLEVFQALKDTRESLKDPATFAAVAEELQGAESPVEAPESWKGDQEVLPGTAKQTTGDLLDRIIEQTADEPIPAGQPPSEWDSFMQEIVGPHLAPRPHPQLDEMFAAVDAATGELMRMILHHPDFQAVEEAWRGLYFLVKRLETDVQLQLYLLDLSKAELAEDLNRTDDLRRTGMYRLLVEKAVETVGGEPWAVVAGNYTFEQNRDDIELLGRMARIAKAAGAPFIAAAGDALLCEKSLAETPDPDDWLPSAGPDEEQAWKILRQLPEAAYLGLVLPRFLLRLPYGADTDPVEGFEFEEMVSGSEHRSYLWGNPCFACSLLLGQAFSRHGWQLRPGSVLDINNLPLHVYRENEESRLKPCAEVLLSQRAAEFILDKGIMPLLSFMNQDTARLARFQAIAEPLRQLSGPWE